MKKHLILTCLGFFFFGVGSAVQQLGIKAGLGLTLTCVIYGACCIFYIVIVLTSMEKLKKKLYKESEAKKDEPIDLITNKP